MIKNWAVKNFKSLTETGEIELPGVTILAGANSSGKSSLLQSILLLKQTVQYGPENRSLLLNGPILKLGSFDDVCHHDAEDREVTISFEISPKIYPDIFAREDWQSALRHSDFADIESIGVKLSFRGRSQAIMPLQGGDGVGVLTPLLDCVDISVRKRKDLDWLILETRLTSREGERDFTIQIDPIDLNMMTGKRDTISVETAWVSHFLPSWAWVEYDLTFTQALDAKDFIISRESILTRTRMPSDPPRDNLKREISALAARHEIDLDQSHLSTFSELKEHVLGAFTTAKPSLRRNSLLAIRSMDEGLRDELGEAIMRGYREDYGVNNQIEPEFIPSLERVVPFIKSYFKDGIRYLGPLRDAPKPVYQPEALENTTSVGYRGEHTAAVLDINKERMVNYRAPPKNAEDFLPDDLKKEIGPLIDAVIAWMSYLEVADAVRTSDAGVFGNRLQISPSGTGKYHDLTNVGVGVSQVLPIIVSSLLSAKGSTLIFEQPELHLHPRVQSRLADFFLALSLDSRNIIIETHSEYLVDRMRLRIAQSEGDDILQRLSILFSRKSGGKTSIEPVKVNKFGAISNWPEDFFDQSQADVTRLLRAASEKRKKAFKEPQA